MRMILVAGALMLALFIAILGSVSADGPSWTWTATNSPPDFARGADRG